MRGLSLLGVTIAVGVTVGVADLRASETGAHPQRTLVREGKPTSCLILPDAAPPGLEKLCREWIARVRKSTGAEIPLYRESAQPETSGETVRIYVGATRRALDEGLLQEPLPEESYRVIHRGPAIYLLASESRNPHPVQAPSAPLRWALNRMQEEGLGVRFLWPGELGTWVPQRPDFRIAGEDVSYRPPLSLRVLRMSKVGLKKRDAASQALYREGIEWAQNHEAGRRDEFVFGHAFIHWWNRYSSEHPDFFALPPEGISSPIAQSRPAFVKLRLSNPEVVETIAREYEKAGAPKYWNICPNDGSGFDLHPDTLAWDEPKGQALQDIWEGNDRANLTARYVRFWNLVSERLRRINPEVTLVTYAYWSYRYAPASDRPLAGKTIVGIVDGWDAYDTWKGWRAAGAELSLRPNWGYYSAGGPAVWVDEIVRFMQFAHQNGLIGFDLDQITGNWGTEGLNYYAIARSMSRPDLSAEDLVAEYCEAFGAASEKIRDYFRYWQQRGTEFGYPIPAGGTTGPNPGKYRELLESGALSDNYYHAPYAALPLLYTDEVLAPAFTLLEEARELLPPESEEYKRVEFLRAGLNHHRLMRNAIALGLGVKEGKTDEKGIRDFRNAATALDRFRQQTPFPHLVWPYVTFAENRFKAPIRPANIKAKMVDTITIE